MGHCLDILNEELSKTDPQKELNTIINKLSRESLDQVNELDVDTFKISNSYAINESRALNTISKSKVLNIITQLKGYKTKKYNNQTERDEAFQTQMLLIGRLIVLSISLKNKSMLNKVMTFV